MAAAWSPILLLLLWGQSAAAWRWALCRPSPLSTRHPVLGFWERIRAGSGCASRGRSASGREVHVLVLRGPAGRMGARQVSLELGPAPPGRAPIFVLSSPAPVVWSLQTAQVALGEQWTFQVSLGSRVSALGGVTVTETRLPQTPRGLLRWVHEEHGGLSSLAAYRGINMVYVQLGDDGVLPGACKLRRNFVSPTHFASDLQPRPLRGCLTSDPPWDPEVHIILSKGTMPGPPTHLTVELQAPGGCCSPRRELIVVLKSEVATSWLVRIHHMAGRLRVLASHEVSVSSTEPEPDLAVSSSISLGLAYASDPMAWAMEQGLPGITSYTEAEQVNRFLVIVGLDGDPKAPHPSIPLPRPAKISPMVWERSRAASGGGSAVRLAGALSVACLSERVAVHVNKDMLQAARLSPARVTLRDPSCAAQSNGTHFLLESPLAGCGALRIPALDPTSGVWRYQNAVVLWGSKPGAVPRGPPLPVGQAEDSSESIEFSCSSPALSQPSRSAEPIPDLPFHLGRVLLSLEVYSSEAFAKAQGPCTVSANSRVFVEAALAAFDPGLSFSIRLCFLSPSSSSSLDSPYILVREGCPAHPDVSLHPPHTGAAGRALSPSSQELQRLSFLLRPLYNDSIQFLHCCLALCTQEPQGQAGAYGGALPKVCTTLPDDTGRIKAQLLLQQRGGVSFSSGSNVDQPQFYPCLQGLSPRLDFYSGLQAMLGAGPALAFLPGAAKKPPAAPPPPAGSVAGEGAEPGRGPALPDWPERQEEGGPGLPDRPERRGRAAPLFPAGRSAGGGRRARRGSTLPGGRSAGGRAAPLFPAGRSAGRRAESPAAAPLSPTGQSAGGGQRAQPWPRSPRFQCGSQAGACPSSRVTEPSSGRFQYTFTKAIIVTVGSLTRATKPTPGTADPFPVPFPLAGRRGKVLKEAPRPEQGETPPAPLPQGLELPTVVGIVFSAFVVGVSLTGGLWLIHSRTAHRGLPVHALRDTLAPAPPSPPAGAQPCGSRDQQPIGLCSAQPGRQLGEGPLHLARRAPSL